MSDKCVLTQCCCGCTLRTGALTTAIICLVASIINVIFAIYQLISEKAQIGWFSIVLNAIMLIAAILLMHGIRKDKPRLIRIWMYMEIVIVIFLIINVIAVFVSTFDIFGLIFGLVIIAVIIYLILVVRSYALQLESGGGTTNTV